MAAEVVRAGLQFVYESTPEVLGYWFGEGSTVVVAEERGLVVGTYSLKANQPGRGSHVANAGYMVREESRGRGIGRALCEHSLEAARERGFRSMQFNMVVSSNPGAIALWKDLGFRVAGTLPRVFRLDAGELVDAHVMVRDL